MGSVTARSVFHRRRNGLHLHGDILKIKFILFSVFVYSVAEEYSTEHCYLLLLSRARNSAIPPVLYCQKMCRNSKVKLIQLTLSRYHFLWAQKL